MFHAVISDRSRGPLRLSGSVTPYDLEVLREHVLAHRGQGTRVEVRFAPTERAQVVRALGGLERFGVEIVLAS